MGIPRIQKTLMYAILFTFLLSGLSFAVECGYDGSGYSYPCKCGDTLMTDYTMPGNLLNDIGGTICPGKGLIIAAEDITLDCAGYSVTGSETPGDVGTKYTYGITDVGGVYMSEINYVSNYIIVKNCIVKNFMRGFLFSGSSNHTLINNTASLNDRGIAFYDSSNSTLINNNASSNGDMGIVLFQSLNNNLTNNTASSNSRSGIYLYASSFNNLKNNTAKNNDYAGIQIDYPSHNNSIINNTANENGRSGIYLQWKPYNNTLIENNASLNGYLGCDNCAGIYLSSSPENTLINNTASDNHANGIQLHGSNKNRLIDNIANNNGYRTGIWLRDSRDNYLEHNTANSNRDCGIWYYRSSESTSIDNTLKENGVSDICFRIDQVSECNNIIENNIGSGNWPIKYYNDTAILQNEVLSELILCNADNSYIKNVTIEGSATKKNNLLHVLETDDSTFTDINSSYNRLGITFGNSDGNSISNSTFNYNGYNALSLGGGSDNNNVTNITALSNWGTGIDISHSEGNRINDSKLISNFEGIIVYEASNNVIENTIVNYSSGYHGIRFYYSHDNTLLNNEFSGSQKRGISLFHSSGNIFKNITANDNGEQGIYLEGSSHNIFENITANENSWSGVYLTLDETPYAPSNYNTLTNITANDNTWKGIHLQHSSNNNITNSTVSWESLGVLQTSGILLTEDSNDNILTNNIISNGWYGVALSTSPNNIINESTVTGNKIGIYLSDSSENIIRHSIFNSNTVDGIRLEGSSSGNKITNITAKHNQNNGIYLGPSTTGNVINESTIAYNKNGIYWKRSQNEGGLSGKENGEENKEIGEDVVASFIEGILRFFGIIV